MAFDIEKVAFDMEKVKFDKEKLVRFINKDLLTFK